MAESRLGDFRKREVTILSVHIGRVAIFPSLFFLRPQIIRVVSKANDPRNDISACGNPILNEEQLNKLLERASEYHHS